MWAGIDFRGKVWVPKNFENHWYKKIVCLLRKIYL